MRDQDDFLQDMLKKTRGYGSSLEDQRRDTMEKRKEEKYRKDQNKVEERRHEETKDILWDQKTIQERFNENIEKGQRDFDRHYRSGGPSDGGGKGLFGDFFAAGATGGLLVSWAQSAKQQMEETEELFSSTSAHIMLAINKTRTEAREMWIDQAKAVQEVNRELERAYFNSSNMRDAFESALKTGVTDEKVLSDMAKTLMIAFKLVPEIDLVSYNLFKEVIDFYEGGSEVVLDLVTSARALSQEFWVDPDTLLKSAERFHRFVRSVSRSEEEYGRRMKNMMAVTVAFEDSFLDASAAFEQAAELAFKPVYEISSDEFTKFSRLNINLIEWRRRFLEDEAGAMMEYEQGRFDFFVRHGLVDPKTGQLIMDTDRQKERLIEFGGQMGFKSLDDLAHTMQMFPDTMEAYQKAQEQIEKDNNYQQMIQNNIFLGIFDHIKNTFQTMLDTNRIITSFKTSMEENFNLTLKELILIAVLLKMYSVWGATKTAGKWIGTNLLTKAGRKALLPNLKSSIMATPAGASMMSKLVGTAGTAGTASQYAGVTMGPAQALVQTGTAPTTGLLGQAGKLSLKGGLIGKKVAGAGTALSAKGGLIGAGGAALASNPIGWTIAAILALGAAVWLVVKNWDKIKERLAWVGDAWKNAMEPIKDLWGEVQKSWEELKKSLEPLKKAWADLREAMAPIREFLRKEGTTFLTEVFKVLLFPTRVLLWVLNAIIKTITPLIEIATNVVESLTSMIAWVTDRFERFGESLSNFVEWVRNLPGVRNYLRARESKEEGEGFWGRTKAFVGIGTETQPVRAFAEGGLVTKPTLGLVGEEGPELILPLSRFFKPDRVEEYKKEFLTKKRQREHEQFIEKHEEIKQDLLEEIRDILEEGVEREDSSAWYDPRSWFDGGSSPDGDGSAPDYKPSDIVVDALPIPDAIKSAMKGEGVKDYLIDTFVPLPTFIKQMMKGRSLTEAISDSWHEPKFYKPWTWKKDKEITEPEFITRDRSKMIQDQLEITPVKDTEKEIVDGYKKVVEETKKDMKNLIVKDADFSKTIEPEKMLKIYDDVHHIWNIEEAEELMRTSPYFGERTDLNPFRTNPNVRDGGNCTWYAHGRMLALGADLSDLIMRQNASEWAREAEAFGHTVIDNPTVGSIVQWGSGKGGYGSAGHVGIVEKVHEDGSFDMSHSGWTIQQRKGQRYDIEKVGKGTARWDDARFIQIPLPQLLDDSRAIEQQSTSYIQEPQIEREDYVKKQDLELAKAEIMNKESDYSEILNFLQFMTDRISGKFDEQKEDKDFHDLIRKKREGVDFADLS